MDAGFTPGPWDISLQGNVIVQSDSRQFVCDLNGVVGHDANLIKTAPELYDVLVLVDEMFSSPGSINKNSVRDKVRTILAQVRGER